jgi:dsDNA-specific endonuclease/ATPase MutS2
MNAPVRSPIETIPDPIADARQEVWRLLQSVSHYCHCAQLHLEVADDLVALYDMQSARAHFISAIQAFEPVRAPLWQSEGGAR